MPGTSSRNDPLTNFNFIIDIQGMRAGFSEVSGLSGENAIVEYREGNQNTTMTKLPGLRKYNNIMLKRGFTLNGKELWNWRRKVIDGKTQRLPGTITLLDEARNPALIWKFYEAWPSKWAGPTLNAKNNEIAIEELEIAVEALELET
jgi:phage tail-like protein